MYGSPQLDDVLSLVREVFGDDLAGVYLHGSAVLGSMSPTSDLDVLVVTRRGTTDVERRRLVDRLLELSVPPSQYDSARPEERPIELTIVVEIEVRPWRYPPLADFKYGDWDRSSYEQGMVPGSESTPDLALVIDVARRASEALIGPPPASFFEPIPRPDLVAAMVAGLDGLRHDLESDTRNVLLTLARIRLTLATGEIRSKAEAGAWLLERLPEADRPVMARARDLYLAGEYGPFAGLEDRIRPLAEQLVAEIRRSVPDPASG
jgi:streptomycin 3"-adenylyltransferase